MLQGGDLSAYLVRPRPGSDVASVAVVSSTSLPGFQAAYERLPLRRFSRRVRLQC